MSSLLGGRGCPQEGGGGGWHPSPSHLPRVTRYSLSMLFPHDQGGWTLELPAVAWWALDLPGFSNYLLVLMTRLVLNLHTAYSDVGGTTGNAEFGDKHLC
jgi:hypothetical protein